jgi:hypothetical protein
MKLRFTGSHNGNRISPDAAGMIKAVLLNQGVTQGLSHTFSNIFVLLLVCSVTTNEVFT